MSHANPCQGKGTKLFFVNGTNNDRDTANTNLKKLKELTLPGLSQIKNLQYELAWVEGLPQPVHLALAAAQRGVDDFQRFWLWVHGLEQAPDWFDDWIVKSMTDPHLLDATVLPRLKTHLEQFSRALLDGYEVVIVSHSVGNIYANAALRALVEYVPAALQPSLSERTRENFHYPTIENLVANIQIGSPVAETVYHSAWINFKDDQVLNGIRKVVDVLPGNVSAPGVGPDDQRGHSLIPSYLRIDESRNRLIQHIQSAHQRLRYPIPFFEPAATVEAPILSHGNLSIEFRLGSSDITRVEKERKTQLIDRYRAHCYDLRPGTVGIRAETTSDDSKHREFTAKAFVGSPSFPGGQPIQMKNTRAIHRWNLGRISVSPGTDKNPIHAQVEFFGEPTALK